MKVINAIALALVIIGGLNWGAVGIANYNAVAAIFGDGTSAARVVYTLVGLAALYSLSLFRPVTSKLAKDQTSSYTAASTTL